MAATSDDKEIILHDFFPMMRVYRDGRIHRLTGLDVVPPSLDPTTGVHSKDVDISPEINLSARIYLPPNADQSKNLPLLVYYHGGGFIVDSAFSPQYQKHLNHLVAAANVVAVLVNYRLAPEFPLPVAFEDSWRALQWTAAGNDEWIKEFADLNRLYLGGDSVGGNIAHNIAMRVGSENPGGFTLRGIFLNCPYFWGAEPIGCETVEPYKNRSELNGRVWRFVCPSATRLHDPWINPGKDPKIAGLGCRKVLVYVAGKDAMKDRGWYYKEVLSNSGWNGEIECVEVEEQKHCFSVFDPDGEAAMAMLKKLASFINDEIMSSL